MSQVLEGEVVLHREADGRVVVTQAPPVTRMSLAFLASADPVTVKVSGNRVSLGGQVAYRVVGWDAHGSALLLEREAPLGAGPIDFPPGAGMKGA